jgi:hypothetical protein
MYEDLPDKAISIMQPWSFLIVNRFKAIENRDWQTKFRGTVAIHSGKKVDGGPLRDLIGGEHPVTYEPLSAPLRAAVDDMGLLPAGGIVGVADIVDCVDHSDSDWFVGKYGFVLANQRSVPFIPCKGALGLFKWKERVIDA